MALSWNEIRARAIQFVREHENDKDEKSQYADFWQDFFDVFGVRRQEIARLEYHIKKPDGKPGWIDVFWPGKFLIEHKSTGENLDDALGQALGYVNCLPEQIRPQYIAVSDFQNIHLYELGAKKEKDQAHKFTLKEFPEKVSLFAFIPGYEERVYKEEDEVNRKAVKIIVKLYSALNSGHYEKEYLSRLMVRLVFMFFADDSGIWEKDTFKKYLEYEVKEDGSDFGAHLGSIFQILNTPEDKRQKATSSELNKFPYVNGGLFADPLPLPMFDKEMWLELREAASFNWSAVSPAIFGSLFQYVMDEESSTKRHDFGAHYTSEKNILKVISGLFLDDLEKELEQVGTNRVKLEALQNKLASIKLLDPACGCGNFLVVAYRELRLLEHEIIRRLHSEEIKKGQRHLSLDMLKLSKVSIRQMHGIEILDPPVQIAKLSLWLVDHQMNMQLGDIFGTHNPRLPLEEQPPIICGNALTMDWQSVIPSSELTYILGNPPFIAKQDQNTSQKEDMQLVFGKDWKGAGELDFVSAWYVKAVNYIKGTDISVGFVSTNSITQGEQVGILWPNLLASGVKINFAHRTFKWTNEAKGKAGVYCVIIGFSMKDSPNKRIFDYDDVRGEAHEIETKNINPYLVDAENIIIKARSISLQAPGRFVPPHITFGSMPNDGGLFIFSDEKEKDDFLEKEPVARPYVKPFLSAKEYLNGKMRYCLWLEGVSPEKLRAMPEVMQRIRSVQALREVSPRKATQLLAKTPALFGENRQPNGPYILIPLTSSERRIYIPFSIFNSSYIAGNTCAVVHCASSTPNFYFGVLQSLMHMTWMRAVCGRLKSDYRYSNELVYNNFPWPDVVIGSAEHGAISEAVEEVLEARKKFPNATLADLYDPNTMPKELLDAHHALDRAVDKAYGVRGFDSEPSRLRFLFERYRELTDK